MQKRLFLTRIIRLAGNEVTAAFRDGRMILLAFASWIIFFSALYIGYSYYRTASADRILSQHQVRQLWLQQEDKNPHAAGHYGTYTFKPLSIFSIIEKGTDPYTGEAIRIETHKQNPPEVRTAEDTTFLLRSGEFTIGFAALYIIPLLIIIIIHGMISKEKEQGTLKLILSQGITKTQLLLGKVLGAISILSVSILPVAVVSGWIIFKNVSTEENVLESAGMLLLSYLIYFMIFLFISIAVSAACETTRKSLLLLFTFWIMVCIIIPKLSVFTAETLYPTPSAYEFTENIEKKTFQGGYESISHWQDLNKKAEKKLAEKNKTNNSKAPSVNVFGYALQLLENEGHTTYEHNYRRIDSLFMLQNKTHSLLSVFSPFTNMKFISMGATGTDVGEYFHFINSSEKYRRSMMNILNKDIMEHQKNKEYKGNEKLWKQVPDYSYTPRNFETRCSDYIFNVQLLVLWLIFSVFTVVFFIKRLNL
ncbi:ABC transporter permease subunit [Chryseobacterium sp.]|uniref:ABC transporter permease subunit n=1 Tax=Chryseobacterium sp. TaxID=1871047 RepID=UPI0025B7AFDC|nr:ABC transporter permease subunit [Chryseobacterium sp.]MBV8326810.1 ABC transporter permease subunit [Chryseobacterium sp.]